VANNAQEALEVKRERKLREKNEQRNKEISRVRLDFSFDGRILNRHLTQLRAYV